MNHRPDASPNRYCFGEVSTARGADPKSLRALYDKTLRFALLAAEAERAGYGKHDTVMQAVKQNSVQGLMKADFDEATGAAAITKEEIAQDYEGHVDE